MSFKAILVFCAQALFVQSAFSQCLNRPFDATGLSPFGYPGSLAATGFNSLGYDGLAYPGAGLLSRGLGYDGFYGPAMEFTATSGGGLPVTSGSTMAPIGISVMSDNVYEGALAVAGELPFVGTTGMEGLLGTAGSGAVNHACGNGINAMSALSATSTPASVASPGPFAAPALTNPLGATAFGATALGYNSLMAPGVAAPGLTATGLGATGLGATSLAGAGLAYNNIAYNTPFDAIEFTATSGGALPVSSASPVPPTGIAVASDNAYEGALTVGGEMPFVGTVGIEGVVPSAGAGAVNHACGNGRNAMLSGPTAFAPSAAIAQGFGAPGFGYRSGFGYAF